MSFCRDCANLMLPQASGEDNRLQFVCRTCQHTEYADEYRVYFHNLEEEDGERVRLPLER